MQIQENVIHRPRQNSLQDLHNSSHHRIRRVNAYVFQIWKAPAGYEELGKGLEPIRNGEMLNSRHPVWYKYCRTTQLHLGVDGEFFQFLIF